MQSFPEAPSNFELVAGEKGGDPLLSPDSKSLEGLGTILKNGSQGLAKFL